MDPEGYERLAQAKALGTSMELKKNSGSVLDEDFIPSVAAEGPSSLSSVNAGPSNPNASAAMSNGDDSFDMFAEDDENPPTNPTPSEGKFQNAELYLNCIALLPPFPYITCLFGMQVLCKMTMYMMSHLGMFLSKFYARLSN